MMHKQSLQDTWIMFQRENNCSIDRMLCCPSLRSDFLIAAKMVTECDDEEKLLWSLLQLRKSKQLSRKAD